MPRTVAVVALSVAMLAGTGFANSSGLIAEPGPGPVIRWEKSYDRSGTPLPADRRDGVGADSLFFRNYYSLTLLYGSPKSEVPNPTPESCRHSFSWQYRQNVVGMDPAGDYIYEVFGTNLRRHSTSDGSYTDYAIARGYQACGTDGRYVYAPVQDTVHKYTLAGTLVSSTALDITPTWYAFSVANDTVWCGPGTGTTVYGYACAKFSGGALTADATWEIGPGINTPALVAWDGQYYYVSWDGYTENTFKRFGADRTLLDSGSVTLDVRGVMCVVPGGRRVSLDSLYWKLFASATNLYSSAKAEDVTPAQPTPFAWQYIQTVSAMTPDGRYVFEVSGTSLRRTDLSTGDTNNYTLADTSDGCCGTDGEYVYVPNGTTTRKYTLQGDLVSSTTTDYAPWSAAGGTFGFGVANDTVWLTPADTGTTWYGYACSKFTGGSVTHDATWATSGGDAGAMSVTYDGQYYYMTWGGHSTNEFMRFDSDRTLSSSGTVTGDARSVMCVWDHGSAIAEPGTGLPSAAGLQVSPNPVRSGLVSLRYSLPGSCPATLTVYDVAGRPAERTVVAAGREGTVRLDLGELSDGVYLVRLEAGQRTAAQKLVLKR